MLTVTEFFILTDQGKVRSSNQDCAHFRVPEDSGILHARGKLFALADGMGGYRFGEVASRVAVDTLLERYYTGKFASAPQVLREAVVSADQAVRAKSKELGDAKMGTTLTCAAFVDDVAIVGHVGDTRAYLVRGGEVSQLTEDHNKAAEMVREGALTAEEAEGSELKSRLTRSLGGSGDASAVDIAVHPLADGDILVLCSDGLHNLVKSSEVRDAAVSGRLEEGARRLMNLALERGAPDNVTVVMMKVGVPGNGASSAGRETSALPLKMFAAAAIVVLLACAFLSVREAIRLFHEFRVTKATAAAPAPSPEPAAAPPQSAMLIVYTEEPLEKILLKAPAGMTALPFSAWKDGDLRTSVVKRVPSGDQKLSFLFREGAVTTTVSIGYPDTVVSLSGAAGAFPSRFPLKER